MVWSRLSRDFRKKTHIQAFTMCFLPQDPNHIYIGTDGVSRVGLCLTHYLMRIYHRAIFSIMHSREMFVHVHVRVCVRARARVRARVRVRVRARARVPVRVRVRVRARARARARVRVRVRVCVRVWL